MPSLPFSYLFFGRRQTQLLAFAVMLLMGLPVSAQIRLPKEDELNPLGLTMMWWAQATIDRNRDEVQFITNDEQNVYLQSRSGLMTTFNVETGERRWSKLLGIPDRVGYPAATNDRQILVSIGSNVISMDKLTGQELWKLRVPELPSASPEVDDNLAYVGTVDGSVYAFDLKRVRELHQESRLPEWAHIAQRWHRQAPGEITSSPISTGTTVSFASKSGVVIGVNTRDKQPRYDFYTDGQIVSPVGRSEDLIFVTDDNGRLFCINQDNGQLRWTYSTGTYIQEQPRAIGHQLFIITHRRGMECLSVAGGNTMWSQAGITEFIAASETRIYGSDVSGNLIIMNRQDGSILGTLRMRKFGMRIANDRTDRIVLSTPGGLIVCLRESGAEFPAYHLFPNRQPILPEMFDESAAPEEPEAPAAPAE
ncbi:MAG: PQQ-like beta-propeller repeat protein [Planctomycetaceae bacterium]|nr:PQQ-like beta-propeller repeat protein [Planctomycetaceae bacterium]MCB9953016.1 PQQ-like beta-propeller repeat protein [Planctomycetaceae bacterium]